MKFIKFLTRKYNLFEHWLITESLSKNNTSIKGIYYDECMDISQKGLVSIYATKNDFERNRQWVINQAQKNSKFIEVMLDRGIKALRPMTRPPERLLIKIDNLSNKEIIQELNRLKKIFFNFSGYLDFDHYLGGSGIQMTSKEVKKFAKFHEHRKKIFMNYFKFFNKILQLIAKRNNIKNNDLGYLTFSEITNFLSGKLNVDDINKVQEIRRKHYIARRWSNKEDVIIDKHFAINFKKVKKLIIPEKIVGDKDIKGMGINRGIVRGRAWLITQTTNLKTVPFHKIIVTQMTGPDMTPILKRSLAIVTDEGGVLCHAANLARESDTLAVVGTKFATKIVKTGDLVEVNANKGTVKIVKKA